MLLGFYRLYQACLKYNFTFLLDASKFNQERIIITLRPNDNNKCEIVLSRKGYGDIFKESIKEMKKYRSVKNI